MLLVIAYLLIVCLLGVNLSRIVWLSIHSRLRQWIEPPAAPEGDLPTVTVQLPIYNERELVHRLINAVCALDYPRDRLQVQVLDDSTDNTTAMIAGLVEGWRGRGVKIEHVRRPDRRGHKAGNLAHALPLAEGELIAIFDADFVPEPAWLRRAASHFTGVGREKLGLVQTNWGHLNAKDSLLTRAVDSAVDQFSIAQTTRTRLGLWSSFYGSAGLWRKACIIASGGWPTDTFSEDLDMAYRAQLAGWSIGYDSMVLAYGELPPTMLAYKQQQFFWSKGNMQVTRLLLRQILDAVITPLQKLDAILFSTWPIVHLLLLLRIILALALLTVSVPGLFWVDLFALAVLSVGLLPTGVDWLRGKYTFGLHLALGIGISLNNTVGLLVGLFGAVGEDHRATTPKSGGKPKIAVTRMRVLITLGEIVIAAAALIGAVIAFQHGRWILTLMLLNDALGFAWVGGQSVLEMVGGEQPTMPPAAVPLSAGGEGE